jgi:hypothetical protein
MRKSFTFGDLFAFVDFGDLLLEKRIALLAYLKNLASFQAPS